MKISNSINPSFNNYQFYKELSFSNLLGSSIHFYNFHTIDALELEVDYTESFFKLVLCINGYSETFSNKKRIYTFNEGKTLLYNTHSNVYHSKLKHDTLFNVIHLHFSKRLAEEINQLHNGIFNNEVIELPIVPNNLELLNSITKMDETNNSFSGLMIEKILLDQLCSFSETLLRCNNYQLKKSHQDDERIEEARRILDKSEHYITIEQLAKDIGINTFKLKQLFKEAFHKNIFEYQVDQKLAKAHQLLLDTNTSLQDISLQCGYQSLGSFSNAFKRKFGIRPSSIRKY
ncbi:helix-turn-helix domain-containing protein [Echinicola shivajiensis]|uniref:helix-turn-helix domain-containing protein n=1 Tax=Echinicola shivajiensis TaxID=1035916 RepID=UPI001BFCAB23|nr:AraC family transcriptional regulator [Echinicola shivajiensis]